MKKPIADRIADIKARQEKLAARLNTLASKAKKEERKRDTRRKIVVGGTIIAAMEKNTVLAELVRNVLNASVTRPQDREVVQDLLPGGHHVPLAALDQPGEPHSSAA
jgi:hypothetical protein